MDEGGTATHVTVSSDWCLLVEEAPPVDGYDMGEHGFVTVGSVGEATPFARHLGSVILAVREEFDPMTGRVALELDFPGGGVRCEGWSGELRLSDGRRGAEVSCPTAQSERLDAGE